GPRPIARRHRSRIAPVRGCDQGSRAACGSPQDETGVSVLPCRPYPPDAISHAWRRHGGCSVRSRRMELLLWTYLAVVVAYRAAELRHGGSRSAVRIRYRG